MNIESGFLLRWLLEHFEYNTVIVLKNTATDFSAFILGVIVCKLFTSHILKDTRLISSNTAEELTITQMKKNGKTKIFITVPKKEMGKMSLITSFIMYLYVDIVKLLPVKKLQFIDSRRIRIGWVVVLIIIAVVCIFNIMMDAHIVLPDGKTGYKVYNLHRK